MEYGQCGVGVSLLLDVEWSAMAVEQGHGSCANLHRFHTDKEQHILANRSMLHQCRVLFAPKPESQKIARMEAKLVQLRRRRAAPTLGRHLYFGDLMRGTQAASAEGASLPQQTKTEVMRQHGALHEALPAAAQMNYESAPAAVTQDAQHTATETIAYHEAALDEACICLG